MNLLTLLITIFVIKISSGSTIRDPVIYDRNLLQNILQINDEEVQIRDSDTLQWQSHAMDFLRLVDLERVLSTAVMYIDDPDVMRFIGFLFSTKFKETVWKIETLEEFKEAFMFLEAKGYDVESVINFVNSGLSLPPFTTVHPILRYSQGVNGFIAAMIGSLPLEEMKDLFRKKLEMSPEFANLYEVLASSEFTDIVKRMFENPKSNEIKMTFESYGVDFDFMCLIAEEIFGKDYHGMFCAKN